MSREERFLSQSTRFGMELAKIGQLPARGTNWLKLDKLNKTAEKLLAERVRKKEENSNMNTKEYISSENGQHPPLS